MKNSFKFFVAVLLALSSVMATPTAKAQVAAGVNFSFFYDNLKPYGRWENDPRYGQIWIYNERNFRPYYSAGHWAYTVDGWAWVSDYPWGWAPFHYGRWAYDPAYGWFWTPGYQWGPAWVSWRTGGDYYGWAPLGPDVSISIAAVFGGTIPAERWVFVPHRYMTSPSVQRYYVNNTKNVTIIKNTTIINNTKEVHVNNNKRVVYVNGPKKEDVERVSHTKVQTMNVSNASKPGATVVDKSRNTINIYRPEINKTVNNNSKQNISKDKTVNNRTVNSTNQANKKPTPKPRPDNHDNNYDNKKPAPKPKPDNNDNDKPQAFMKSNKAPHRNSAVASHQKQEVKKEKGKT